MSAIWLFLSILVVGAIGVVYYALSQMGESEKIDKTAPHIVPGNLQVSKPTKKPPQRSLPPSDSPDVPEDPADKEPPVDFLPPKNPNDRSQKTRFFKNKEDIKRSFIIDELLNRKTK